MKKMRKLVAVILALVMCFAMALPAMAATATTTIKINGDHAVGHTYKIYQIFTGDYSVNGEGAEVLSNVKYGVSYGKEGDPVPQADLQAIETAKDANAFAESLLAQGGGLGSPYTTITVNEIPYEITNVPNGYYLIQDVTENPGEGDAISAYIVEVVGENPVEVTPKADAPIFEKKVQEKNDSTDYTSGWQDGADYDITDKVPFQLKATLPKDAEEFGRYETYKLVFHDEMSKGLTFNNDIVVKVDGEAVESGYVVTSPADDGCSFDVTITDAKSLAGAKAGSEITVEFTATLNQDAVIGGSGNTNEAHIQYSNNPNSDGLGESPDDKVTVFTFKLDVSKVNQDSEPLKGAGFTLYKYDATVGEAGDYVAVGAEIKGEDITDFTWEGLDSGKYKLVETSVPTGYNKADDIEFTITGTYETNSDDPQLTGLNVTDKDGEAFPDDGPKFTQEPTTGSIATTIKNQRGSLLPSTGGIGTTIFYVVGICLVVGAVVILVTRKRVGRNS